MTQKLNCLRLKMEKKTRWLLGATILFFLFMRSATAVSLLKVNLDIVMLSSMLNSFHEDIISEDDAALARINSLKDNSDFLQSNKTIGMAIGIIEYTQGKHKEAAISWQQSGIFPAEALKLRADYAHSYGRFEDALAFYTYSIHYDSNIPEVWHSMGNIYEANGNLELAIQAYEKAWALNNILSVEPLGSLYNELGEYKLAVQIWEQALSEYPYYTNRVVWWRHLLFSMRSAQLWAEMFQSAQEAILEFPNDPQLFIELGFAIQNNSGSMSEAAEAFKTAIRLDDELPSAYAALGNLMVQNQKFDDAFQWYSEAITRDPKNVTLHILQANMARASGNLALALDLYKETSNRFPENARVLYEMAWTYRQTAQKVEALATLDKAMMLNPTVMKDYLLRVGLIYEWAEEEEQAISMYKELLLLEPDNEVAKVRLDNLQK